MSKSLPGTIGVLSWGILSLSAGLAPPASGQEQQPVCSDGQAGIVGVVLDGSTNAPLAGAYVSVEESDWAWLTTDSGRFLLCEIGAGIHLVTVERLGYATHTARVEADTSGDPVSLRVRPEPIQLEGLEIIMDRFERRRRGAATVVRAYDEEALANSGHWSVADFIDSRAGIFATPCGIDRCIYYRGARVVPRVYLDEFPLPGGWAQLESMPTSQLYMVEVYSRGTHIRAYSHGFMKRAANTRLSPFPIWDRGDYTGTRSPCSLASLGHPPYEWRGISVITPRC